ncbi:MAG: hypothetical protein WCC04_16335 [Terriglobales bacterium]
MSRVQTLAKARARKAPPVKAPPRTAWFLTGHKLNALFAILLIALTCALYIPVLAYPFVVLDDRDYVTTNPHLQDGIAWRTIRWHLRPPQRRIGIRSPGYPMLLTTNSSP